MNKVSEIIQNFHKLLRKYLKIGHKLGLCHYIAKEDFDRTRNKNKRERKKKE